MTMLRVLHVDDESDIREVVEISLGLDPDFVARGCGSGQEALAVAAEWLPDIILLDIMMPVMDGPATLKHLREDLRTADIPVVFMTARAQTRELEQFGSLGAAGIIPKPFDPMTLAASVRTYIRPVEARLDALRDHFLQRVNDDATALAGHRSALRNGATAPATLTGIRDIAHGLAGAGGIFGLFEISHAAAELEQAVVDQCDGSGSIDRITSALDYLLASDHMNGGIPREPSLSPLDS